MLKFLRKVWSGLIAVKRHTRAHVPSLQMQLCATKTQKMARSGAKKSVPGAATKIVPRRVCCAIWRRGSSQEYADWIVELSCLDSFFGAEFNNLQQYRHNLFVGVEDTKYKIEEREKYKYFGSIDEIVVHMAQIKRQMQIVIFLQS